MAYVDGFVIAVPTASKQQFIVHASEEQSTRATTRRSSSRGSNGPTRPNGTLPCPAWRI